MSRARCVRCFLLFSLVFLACCSARPMFAEEFRTWVDQTGKFSVEAKLHSIGDAKVVLRTKDGREISVPVSTLSAADQEFVKNESPNPFSGGTPVAMPEEKVERKPLPPPLARAAPKKTAATPQGDLWGKAADAVQELPTDGAEMFIGANLPLPPLKRDPNPTPANFQQMVVFLEKLDAYARVSPPIVIDPARPTFAVSTHRVGNTVAPDHFGRIFLASADKARPEIALDLKETIVLFDHHVATDRSIAVVGVDSPSQRGGDIVLLDGLATGKPQPLTRWHLPEWEKPGFPPKVEFARMLDGDRALVQVNSGLYIWDLLSGECQYQTKGLSSGGELTLSGSGKYLVVPVGGGVRVVDTDSGELQGSVSISTTLTPVAHFSADGSRLALVAGSQFCVWDVVEGKQLVADTVTGVPGTFFGWVSDDLLLTQLAGIIDPNLSMTLWQYSLPSDPRPLTMPGGVAVIDKNGSSGTILMTLPIPHAPVAEVQQLLSGNVDDLLLIKPGTEVSLKIEAIAGVDAEEMQTGLAEAVSKAGWVVNPESPVQLIAQIGRGELTELSFRTLGTGLRGPVEKVSITPYTASLEVTHGQDVLWTRKSENMVPLLIHLKKGQTVQEGVKEYEKPDPKFFRNLTLPPRVLKPEIADKIGRSRIKDGRWRE